MTQWKAKTAEITQTAAITQTAETAKRAPTALTAETAETFAEAAETAVTVGADAPDDFLDGFISEAEYARRRGVSERTCQRDRQLRQCPPYIVVGRRIFYRVDAIRDWLVARERTVDRTPTLPRLGWDR